MSCRGVHFALTADQERRLLGARGNDEAILDIVQEEIESSWDVEWLCQTDKAWDAIHRCLSDGTLNLDGGSAPLNLVILGGAQIFGGDDYIISYLSPSQVGSAAGPFQAFTRSEFDAAYDSLSKTDYDGPINSDDREYTWSYLG